MSNFIEVNTYESYVNTCDELKLNKISKVDFYEVLGECALDLFKQSVLNGSPMASRFEVKPRGADSEEYNAYCVIKPDSKHGTVVYFGDEKATEELVETISVEDTEKYDPVADF